MATPPIPSESAHDAAQQSIAQSTSLALSDATDNLRNLNTISTTTIAVALEQFLESGDDRFITAIEQAQGVVKNGAENFGAVGKQVATVLYPK